MSQLYAYNEKSERRFGGRSQTIAAASEMLFLSLATVEPKYANIVIGGMPRTLSDSVATGIVGQLIARVEFGIGAGTSGFSCDATLGASFSVPCQYIQIFLQSVGVTVAVTCSVLGTMEDQPLPHPSPLIMSVKAGTIAQGSAVILPIPSFARRCIFTRSPQLASCTLETTRASTTGVGRTQEEWTVGSNNQDDWHVITSDMQNVQITCDAASPDNVDACTVTFELAI